MSDSKKKPYQTISKRWTRQQEKAYRKRIKNTLADVEKEIPFDPDADFEADQQMRGEYGTRMGWDVPPGENDTTWMHVEYEKAQRK